MWVKKQPFLAVAATEAELMKVENSENIVLPQAFIQLFKEQNGGYLDHFILSTEEPTSDGMDYVEIHRLLSTDELLLQEQYRQQYHLPSYLFVFSIEGSQLFLLDYQHLRGEEPSVRYIDVEVDQWLTIATSFKQFLTSLESRPLHLVPLAAELDEQMIFSKQRGNHYFMIGDYEDIEQLFSIFEDDADKTWFFQWLTYFAVSDEARYRKLALSYFLNQLFYFHPQLPESAHQLGNLFLDDPDDDISLLARQHQDEWITTSI